MKTWLLFILSIAGMSLVTYACSSNSDFLVFKQGRGYYLGSNSNAKYEMLCASGEMDKVLAASSLSREMKDSLYKYSCSEERSGEKVMQLKKRAVPLPFTLCYNVKRCQRRLFPQRIRL